MLNTNTIQIQYILIQNEDFKIDYNKFVIFSCAVTREGRVCM